MRLALLILLLPILAHGQTRRVFPTLSDLDQARPSRDEPVAEVLGLTTNQPFSNGPKLYRWDPTNALPTNAIRRATVTGVGRWVHNWDGDVQAFGFRGDATYGWVREQPGEPTPTDDAPAIAAAMNYSAESGIRLRFPAKISRLATPIIVTNGTGPKISGFGIDFKTLVQYLDSTDSLYAGTILVRDQTNAPAFVFRGNLTTNEVPQLREYKQWGLEIDNIQFRDRSGLANTNAFMELKRSCVWRWNNVEFLSIYGTALDLWTADDGIASNCRFAGCGINGSPAVIIRRGVSISGQIPYAALNTLHFVSCVWEANLGENFVSGYDFGNTGSSSLSGLFFTDCLFKKQRWTSTPKHAFKVRSTLGAVFSGCFVSWGGDTLTGPASMDEAIFLESSFNVVADLNLAALNSGGNLTTARMITATNLQSSVLKLTYGDTIYGGTPVTEEHLVSVVGASRDVQVLGVSNNPDKFLRASQTAFMFPLGVVNPAIRSNSTTRHALGVRSVTADTNPIVASAWAIQATNHLAGSAGMGGAGVQFGVVNSVLEISNNVATAIGSRTYPRVLSGIATNIYSVFSHGDISAGATGKNWSAFIALPPANSGTLEQVAAFQSSSMADTGASFPYGLYLAGASDRNYIAGRVGIGTTSPNVNAALEISSTNRGFLLPRLTRAQRNALIGPADGLMVFQTDSTNAGPRWYSAAATNWVTAAGTPDP